MRPNSVFMPVAMTTARPVPLETLVPSKIRLGISKRVRPSSRTGSWDLRTGLDSPVSVDWLTCMSLAAIKRASAEMRAASSMIITSPGTRSSARICTSLPSRMTRALAGSMFFSASVALPARNSCQKLNRPFRTLTIQIAYASSGMPVNSAIKPPIQSMMAIRLMKFSAKTSSIGLPLGFAIVFLP